MVFVKIAGLVTSKHMLIHKILLWTAWDAKYPFFMKFFKKYYLYVHKMKKLTLDTKNYYVNYLAQQIDHINVVLEPIVQIVLRARIIVLLLLNVLVEKYFVLDAIMMIILHVLANKDKNG